MNTNLVYLEDTYNFELKAKFVTSGSDEKGSFIVLDSTIFYPQGGGQPSDIGVITSNIEKFEIHFVAFVEGIVKHYTNNNISNLVHGEEVNLSVDIETRKRNAKIHTAGHLLGSIVEKEIEGLIAVKGYHFPDGSYVEFNSSINSSDELKDRLNFLLKEKLSKAEDIETKIVSFDELVSICKHVPEYIPKDKPLRVVFIHGFEPVPCGGTHLKSLSEIKNIEIRKISSKKGQAKISYSCE